MNFKAKATWRFAVPALLLIPALAAAQKMDSPKPFEAGDKTTFSWVLNNKAQEVSEEWGGGSADEMQGVQRLAGKEFAVAVGRQDWALRKSMCFSNGQPCTFSPGFKGVDFPLEKGKKWSNAVNVKGDTFTADVTSERRVEKLEKVKVPAGEFDAFRVYHKGRIKGTDNKGGSFSGNEDSTEWFALVNAKLVLVKSEYRNSFGEKFVRELTAISFK